MLCECSELHRCDHVRGCVLKEVSSTAYSKTEHITSILIATSRFTTFNKVESSQGIGPVEVSTNEDMTVSILDENGISRNHLLIYSGTVTGIIFLLALTYCLNNVRKRKTKTLPSVSANENIVHTGNDENVQGRSDNFEMNEDVYHTIDESNIETTAVDKCSPYLEVIEGSSSSESMPNSQSDTSSFPKPYSGLKEDESVNQKKILSLEINKDSHGQHNATNSTDSVEEGCDECVTPNPCITLAETAQDPVRYHNTTQVVIHKEQSSSSDSENETQDSNNYLNPYVPLKKEKDAYSYDIPLKMTGENTS
ncbi:uncharacterized protein LOC127729518 [Mytilus californianus]|uniref:uncharacterized protein LOC127729518 n=1 Tax=Mytilus californianus TaxID=6549 RepID=UPI002245F14E|nr:uncharacterized protein LOC127729518 [Mytilus californianus]